MSIIVRRCCSVLTLVVAFFFLEPRQAFAQHTALGARSATIQIPSDLQPEVDRMLRVSPTFRAQYRRIAATRSTLIGVRVDPALAFGGFKARSDLRRYDSGLIVVVVWLGPGRRQ